MPSPPSSLDYSSLLHVLTLNRWVEFTLRGEWRKAERAAGTMSGAEDPFWKWLGLTNLALSLLYRGRSLQAMEHLKGASRIYSGRGPLAARALAMTAEVLLARGEPEPALERARQVCNDGRTDATSREGVFLQAVAHSLRGDLTQAEKVGRQLAAGPEPWRGAMLSGELLRARGDARAALVALREAETLLTRDPHAASTAIVPVWYALGSACLDAGEGEDAPSWLGRVISSGRKRLDWPLPYVRSLYLMGQLESRRGRLHEARGWYERFIECFGDGDLDRAWVEDARGAAGEG